MVYYRSRQKIFDGQKALLILTICITLVLAFYLFAPSPVLAQLYRLVDHRGTILFTDTIYRWSNDKGEVYYTNYTVYLTPEEFMTMVKGIEVGSIPEERRAQYIEDSRDIMVEIKKRFPEIGPWTWTQDMSLWVKVPASFAINKPACEDLADSIARFYRAKKGHMVCVRIYYGNQKVIAKECR